MKIGRIVRRKLVEQESRALISWPDVDHRVMYSTL